MGMFMDAVAKNGRTPRWLTRIFKDASPSNPQAFSNAYQMFTQLRSANPAGYQQLFTDEVVTKFESYEVLLNDYGTHALAVEKLADADYTLPGKTDRDSYNEGLEDVRDAIGDGPFFDNVDPDDPRLRKLAKTRYDHFISLGYTPERAAEFAVNGIEKRYTIANGQMWPNTSLVGMSAPVGEVIDHAATVYKDSDPEGRDYEVVPHTGRPGWAWVRPKGSLAFAGEPVKLSELDQRYSAFRQKTTEEAAAKRQAETKAENLQKAKQRATGLYSIPHDKSIMGDRLRALQDEAWDALPAAVRQATLDEIEKEQEAARADRERRMNNPDIMVAP